MGKPDPSGSRTSLFRAAILKGLFLYALFPFLCLWFLARPVSDAVRGSEAAAFLILLAALGCAALNWFVYSAVHRRPPSLLMFAFGVSCVLAVSLIEYEALPASRELAVTLSVIAGCLALLFLFLLSLWLAARRSRPAHVAAVGLWITIGVIAFFMLYRVIRDFESRNANQDTWITIAILAALLAAAVCCVKRSAIRRGIARRAATGLTGGRIVQLVGITRLDLDDDPVTSYHARVQYTVGREVYETRAPIRKLTMRRFGKKAFVGREIPVHYCPDNPSVAFADRIDRHLFDQEKETKE